MTPDEAGKALSSYVYSTHNPGELPYMVRDAMRVFEDTQQRPTLIDAKKLLPKIRQHMDDAKRRMDSADPGSTAWHLWEWRYDALEGVQTMIQSGAYNATT